MRLLEITAIAPDSSFWFNATSGEVIRVIDGGHSSTVYDQPDRFDMDADWIAQVQELEAGGGEDEYLYNSVFTDLKKHHWVRGIVSLNGLYIDAYWLDDARKALQAAIENISIHANVEIELREPKGYYVLEGRAIAVFLKFGRL